MSENSSSIRCRGSEAIIVSSEEAEYESHVEGTETLFLIELASVSLAWEPLELLK